MVKIKQIIKYIVNLIIDLFIFENLFIKQKTILLLRLDAIGDYVLFRNFIEILRNEYKDYEITLVGNKAWKNLAESLDKEYIDKFIWLDIKKFENNPFYRLKKLKEITKHGYEIVINPRFNRVAYKDDAIVKVVSSNKKIGSEGNKNLLKNDKIYDILIPAKNEVMFEFYRNKEFFENLLNKKLSLKKPFINLPQKKLNFNLPDKYVVLFIGASEKFRKWNIKNFVEIGKYLKEKYNYEIILCGGPGDIEDGEKFKDLADYEFRNLVGKTSLIDFLYVLKNSDLLLSNETSAPHFAVALNVKKIFVLSNGNHFGRFIPYPREIYENYFPVFPLNIENNFGNFELLVEKYGKGSSLDINKITVEYVKSKIDKVLS